MPCLIEIKIYYATTLIMRGKKIMDHKVYRFIHDYGERVLDGGSLSREEAFSLDQGITWTHLPALFEITHRIREKFFGKSVDLCAIINAKSGYCGEDCIFCAQSLHHQARVSSYPLLSAEQIIEKAMQAKTMGAHCFSLVTSGG